MRTEWNTFKGGVWQREINVRDFIQKNYTPYDGSDEFLEGPTRNTTELWEQVMELSKKEQEAGGVLDMDTKIISTITSHGPGYLNKDKETIVGFQTDKPFKRSLQPYGGIRMAMKACQDNGYEVDPEIVEFFTKHRKTHNAGVFDAYTPEMRACRSSHIITGLPDAYGRGRIIGDYRRIALYGVDALIQEKKEEKDSTRTIMYSDVIREREELSEQIRALEDLKELGNIYGFDISKPACDVREAIQWTYASLQQGIVDGAENTELALTVDGHQDLVKSYTYTEHQYSPDIYIISTKTWNRMTREQQDYLVKGFEKTNENFKQLYNGMMDQAMEEAESNGVHVYRDIDKTAFIQAVQPIHNKFCAKGESYKALYDDIQKYAE